MEKKSDAMNVRENTIDTFNLSMKGNAKEVNKKEKAYERRVKSPINKESKLENLPLSLVHYIMENLPTKEVTKFSVLSKAFNSAWLSFPILDFDFDVVQPLGISTNSFFSIIKRTLNRRGPHIMGCLRKLRFAYKMDVPSIHHSAYPFQSMLDALMEFAVQNNCKVLEFDVSILVPTQNFWGVQTEFVELGHDPTLSLFSSKNLTILKFTGLKIPIADSDVTCPTLQVLILRACVGLQTLKASSSSLKDVEIIHCNGLKRVEVKGKNAKSFKFVGIRTNNLIEPCDIDLTACEHMRFVYLDHAKVTEELLEVATDILYVSRCDMPTNLEIENHYVKIMQLKNNYKVDDLVVCAPNMECFEYIASKGQICEMDISECVCLTVLILKGATVNDTWVKTTISALDCLEELEISHCNMLEKIEFVNEKLETFSLSSCSKLKEADVDARNLVEFYYSGSLEVYPLLILSAKCSANVILPQRKDDPSWFDNMLRFLSYFDHFKDLTIACFAAKDVVFPREYVLENKLSPLHDVKNVKIKARDMPKGKTVTQLVDSLLWLVPKPHKFTFGSVFGTTTSSLKFHYWRKVERWEEMKEICCFGIPIKCWRHYGVRIEYEGFDGKTRENLQNFFGPHVE